VKRRTKVLKNCGIISLSTILLTSGLIAVRTLGLLQPFEWAAYDWFFQLRELEPIDERIVIVGMSETDINRYGHPISDRDLARLLNKIKAANPKVIGLDIVRDRPVGKGIEQLNQVFDTTPNLMGVAKVVGESKEERIEPPPALKKLKQGVTSVDVPVDRDGVLRRGIFVVKRSGDGVEFNSLGVHLAAFYLQEKGIPSVATPDKKGTQIGKVSFYPLQKNDGGYVNTDAWDFQFLVNFRNPARSFKKVSVSQVLRGEIQPNFFENKIVMIGMTAVSIKDEFYTPFSHSLNNPPKLIHGVEVQANFASHVLSAVLDGRPIIKVISDRAEYVFIFLWGLATAVAVWIVHSIKNYLILFLVIFLIATILIGLLFSGSFIAFLQGWWLPFVPSIFAIGGTSIIFSGIILWEKNQELKRLQKQLVAEKVRGELADLNRGISHEIHNPLHLVEMFTSASLNSIEEFDEEIREQEDREEVLINKIIELYEQLIESLKKDLEYSIFHTQRALRITEAILNTNRSENQELISTNINELLDSTLKITIYSKQFQYQSFCINLEKDYDSRIEQKKIRVEDFITILINLISNACDAIFERKNKEASFNPTLLVVTKLIDEQLIELTIADNGIGVSPKIADTIFHPFKTTKHEEKKGIGLGLHITYELLKKNGGQIRWERVAGMTRFIVNLRVYPDKN
jgi:adenylate cyclase